ncbi:MSC_0620 family F1-like ATPase-associated subunit [Mycoplasmopsis glycophila]|uniref:Transmembrane protein n=1 Tax=Mycoplasmopsis glycophila TaxID=171285 RepID=A0A449AUK5_9BACT|nr:hypothetical protein [Mycoplasmopsis glycophila]VEU70204.1 Uncharacterised protein [Mycoplasmopsis glycophila]
MKKSKFHLFLGSFVTPVTVFPTVLTLSATGDNESSNTNNADGDNSNSQPTINPSFNTFGEVVDKITQERLSTIIDNQILEFRRKAQDLVQIASASSNEIIKAIYLQKVADYLEDNREAILENPLKYGFNIVYPKVLALNKEIYTATVHYKNQEYPSIKYGVTASYPTEEVFPNETEGGKVNTISLDYLTEKVYTYYDELNTEFADIFANKNDIPTLKSADENSNLGKINTSMSFDDSHQGVTISVPEGFDSWDEYIRSKVIQRFTSFDLLQNSNDDDIDQDDPFPPITSDQAPNDPLEESEFKFVPELKPIIKYEFFETYAQKLKNSANYEELVQESNSDISLFNDRFYFDNPIFTRYEYKIQSLAIEREGNNSVATPQLIVSVKIRDILNVAKTRLYKTTFEIPTDKKTSLSIESASNLMRETYKRFYKALGIGENIQIKNLGNKSLVTTTYNMIVAANNLLKPASEKDQFKKEYFNLVRLYKNANYELQGEERKTLLPQGNYKKELLNLFLGSLDRLTFNLENNNLNSKNNTGYGYFEYLIVTYKKLVVKLKEVIEQKRLSIIKSNFKNFGYDLAVLENGFKYLTDDLDLLSAIINSSSFNIEKKYDHYVLVLEQVQNTLINLSILTTADSLNPQDRVASGDNPSKKFEQAYEKIKITKPIAQKTKKTTTLQILGSIFSFIGLSTLISWILLKLSKIQKIKLSRRSSIILIVVSSLTFLLGITLIILSFIGGIL